MRKIWEIQREKIGLDNSSDYVFGGKYGNPEIWGGNCSNMRKAEIPKIQEPPTGPNGKIYAKNQQNRPVGNIEI